MLQEFTVIVEGKFEEELPDSKSMIDMNRIEAAYAGQVGREVGKTIVMLQSGNSVCVCMSYLEFADIWRTCVEPININQ